MVKQHSAAYIRTFTPALTRLKQFCETYGVDLNMRLLDMVSEVLQDMADENLMVQSIGAEQTALLKRDGHLDHWLGEALAFDQYRDRIKAEL